MHDKRHITVIFCVSLRAMYIFDKNWYCISQCKKIVKFTNVSNNYAAHLSAEIR